VTVAESHVIPIEALFPPKGHRYYTDDDIEALRQKALAANGGTVQLTAMEVIRLICDWRNMTADLHPFAASEGSES
jgi:hypothetical protein